MYLPCNLRLSGVNNSWVFCFQTSNVQFRPTSVESITHWNQQREATILSQPYWKGVLKWLKYLVAVVWTMKSYLTLLTLKIDLISEYCSKSQGKHSIPQLSNECLLLSRLTLAGVSTGDQQSLCVTHPYVQQ